MPINPFPRVQGLDLPVALPSAARAPESAFNNLASIGENIGAYRLRNQIADLVASAGTDEHGNVDQGKAIAALARAGLVSPEQLSRMGYQQQLIAQTGAAQRETARHHGAIEEFQNRPRYQYEAPDPILGGGAIIEERPGQPPRRLPWPGAPAVAPATPGPQSEADIPGAARYAAAGAQDRLPPNYYPPASFDQRFTGGPDSPSEAPVRMAQAGPATQPAPTAARNEDVLRALPTDAFRQLVKDIAEYKADPASIDAKYRTQAVIAASRYRPDYSMAEYQRRAAPPSPEAAARIGLASGFIKRLDDTTDAQGNPVPGIRSRIAAGELDPLSNRAQAFVGQGGPGELRRGIDEGADALLRTLTGAGMNKEEAGDYTRRYRFSAIDTKDTQLRKLNELEAALRHVSTEMGKGRGGEDLLKGFQSQFGRPTAASDSAPVRVSSPDEARRLPKGTKIILPDGTTGRVP